MFTVELSPEAVFAVESETRPLVITLSEESA